MAFNRCPLAPHIWLWPVEWMHPQPESDDGVVHHSL